MFVYDVVSNHTYIIKKQCQRTSTGTSTELKSNSTSNCCLRQITISFSVIILVKMNICLILSVTLFIFVV